jgi:Family of unknown function (DUF5723)
MKNLFILLLLSLLFSFISYAQFGSGGATNARSTGMAKTYNAISDGVNAIGINPANLMGDNNNSIQISTILPLPQISIRGGTNFMSIDDINYYFGGVNGQPRYLSDADKQKFNDLFKDGGFTAANVNINLLSITYKDNDKIGAFGFSINDELAGKFTIPQALVDFALNGNPIGKSYDLSDANAKAWWIRNYSISYARNFNFLKKFFDDFSAGISIKLVNGYAYTGTQEVNTTLSTENDYTINGNADFRAVSAFSDNFGVKYSFDSTEQESNFSPFPTPAGVGAGVDLGFAASRKFWRFALSITDIGSIKWSRNAAEFLASGNISVDDITDKAQIDTLRDKLIGKAQPISGFTTSLPTALRLGTAYYFDKTHNPIPGTLLLAFDYNQGFNDMPGNSVSPRFSLGGEWKPGNWIPFIRTGFSIGGSFGFHWGFGLGIDAGILELNIGTSDLQAFLAPNASKYVSLAIGSRWKL